MSPLSSPATSRVSNLTAYVCNVCGSSVVGLSTLIVIADTDGTLRAQSVCPEATDIDIGLRDGLVGEEQPSTENWLGKDVQNSVRDDLRVNVHFS